MKRARVARECVGAGFFVVLLLVAGCVPAGAARTPTRSTPTKKATMVCATEAQRDIAKVLALAADVTKPTWVDHVYSCTYRYSTGSFTVSVKQLADRRTTINYFDQLGTKLDRAPYDILLGDAAFRGANGSMVVRKDNIVLVVDASNLPAQLSNPELTPSYVATSVAATILTCWKE